MTPEQRLNRLERVAKLMVNAGLRSRVQSREQNRDQNEKINILIQTQMDTTEQIRGLSVAHERLAASQEKTDAALRAYLNSLSKGQNGSS